MSAPRCSATIFPVATKSPSAANGRVRDEHDWTALRARCLVEARRILPPDDAEDAVQEAMARAWRRRAACRNRDEPLAWMLQITRNEALRLRARRARGPEPGLDDAVGVAAPATADAEAAIDLRAALARLPPGDRALVELRYLADLSGPRLAELVVAPEATVRVRLHRARTRLRTLLVARA
jgi:RNA polymerase sigma-70 factor (ECF subfamily)